TGVRKDQRPSLAHRILIADDNVFIGRMFSDALQNLAPEEGLAMGVEIAGNGKEALERLGRDPRVDLLITDLIMEPMNGFELVTEVRKDPRLQKLPIVMVSSSDPEVSRQALRLGVNVYLAKPVNLLHVVRTVQTLLR